MKIGLSIKRDINLDFFIRCRFDKSDYTYVIIFFIKFMFLNKLILKMFYKVCVFKQINIKKATSQ